MTKEAFNQKVENAKTKVKGTVEKGKEKARAVAAWCIDHPAETIGIATVTVAATKEANKLIGKAASIHAIHEEEKRRKLERYDPVTHSWATLRRPLNSREQEEFAERRQNGESAILILKSMNVLKN